MKKTLSAILALVLSLMAIVSCGSVALAEEEPAPMAVLVPCSIGDPFIELCLKGLYQLSEDTGKELRIIETYDKAEYEDQVCSMAELGCNPIYCMWGDLSEVAINHAADYPDTTFILTDVYLKTDAPNISSLSVDPYGASFIGGYIAASKTEVGLVGFIAHADRAVSRRYRDGYMAGVEYANEQNGTSVEVQVAYTGDDQDPVKGSETAILMIEEYGVDIIFQSASLSGLGVISACAEKGVACIGADDWQGEVDPCVFWSVLKPFDEVLYDEGMSVVEGTFVPGDKNLGAAQGLALYDERDFEKLDADLQEQVTEIVEKIKAGEIVLAADENVVQ